MTKKATDVMVPFTPAVKKGKTAVCYMKALAKTLVIFNIHKNMYYMFMSKQVSVLIIFSLVPTYK